MRQLSSKCVRLLLCLKYSILSSEVMLLSLAKDLDE